MTEQSKTLKEAIARIYTEMAAKAAQKAVDKVGYDKCHEAETFAEWAAKWLGKSSAETIRCYYRHPRQT